MSSAPSLSPALPSGPGTSATGVARWSRPRVTTSALVLALALIVPLLALPSSAAASTVADRTALEVHAEQHLMAWHQQARRAPSSFGASVAAVPELMWSSELAALARASSDRMSASGRLGHDPRIREALTGTRHADNVGMRIDGSLRGADIARVNAEQLIRAFMRSAGHRSNLLDGRFTHVGIGVRTDRDGRVWATAVFQERGTSTLGALSSVEATDLDAWCPPTGTRSARFSDVDGVHTQAIDCLADRGLIGGVGGDRFDPYAPITRAQLAMILERAIRTDGGTLPAPYRGVFRDVRSTDTSGDAIERLAAAGIVAGSPQGAYDPHAPISRGQFAAMLQQTVTYLDGDPLEGDRGLFPDVAPSARFAGAIDAAGSAGWLSGDARGRFNPDANLQRDQAASVIARFIAGRR